MKSKLVKAVIGLVVLGIGGILGKRRRSVNKEKMAEAENWVDENLISADLDQMMPEDP